MQVQITPLFDYPQSLSNRSFSVLWVSWLSIVLDGLEVFQGLRINNYLTFFREANQHKVGFEERLRNAAICTPHLGESGELLSVWVIDGDAI